MDSTIVQLLRDSIDKVDAKVDKIDDKLNEMLAFKWQIIGGSVIMSAIIGVAIQIFLAIYGK